MNTFSLSYYSSNYIHTEMKNLLEYLKLYDIIIKDITTNDVFISIHITITFNFRIVLITDRYTH